MTDLTPNHPAVKAGCQAASEWVDDASADETDHIALALHMTAACITAALPHLIADDLRDTPAGRALMAEGWDALIESMSASGEFHDVDLRTMERLNPYRDGDA
ncbi:hypothetical protein M3C53_02170 [Micrococcus luteus]|nr:hypothetical protein [Micrococcus luteus]